MFWLLLSKAPRERPKLNLKPRTVTDDTKDEVAPSSIFGGARPVDTALKEKEIEEKILQEQIVKESHVHENGTADVDTSPTRPGYSHNRKAKPADIEESVPAKQNNDQPDRKGQRGTRKVSSDEDTEPRKHDQAKQYEEPKAPVCDNSCFLLYFTELSAQGWICLL